MPKKDSAPDKPLKVLSGTALDGEANQSNPSETESNKQLSGKTPPENTSKAKESEKGTKDTKNEAQQEHSQPKSNQKKSKTIKKESPSDKSSSTKKRRFSFTFTRRKKIVLGILVFILLLVGVPVGITLSKVNQLKTAAQNTRTHGLIAVEALKNQDLVTASSELTQAQTNLQTLNQEYQSLSFWQYTPLRWHYQDGQRALNAATAGIEAGDILIKAVEPYADVIGFTGQGSFLGGTAQDRIAKIIETLDKVAPSLTEVNQKLEYIDQQLAGINPERYPIDLPESLTPTLSQLATCSNKPLPLETAGVSDLITHVTGCTHQVNIFLHELKPAIEVLPSVAGVDETKTYLIMFQNDGELRPTGGFMTAYAILDIEDGKVDPVKSDDIYELDQKFTERIEAPEPIEKYLDGVFYWNLRDMNLSPDFKVSMDTFTGYYNEIESEPEIQGVIAVDTKLLTDLVDVLGPIEVPGYGVFTSEIEPACDCPNVVYQLENMITRPTPYHRSDRKGVLGPLMQTILLKAYGAPKQVYPELFQTVIKDIHEKHILFYFFDETAQEAAEAINVAGRMQPVEHDYFHLNDTNFGGAKSNMYVTQEIDQAITLDNGQVKKTVTILYKNPRRADNCNLEAGQLCLNGVLPNWTRIYLPKGSELEEALGFEEDSVQTTTEFDRTVIEGFFRLQPESQAKVKLTYTIPYTPENNQYHLYLQKQPGKEAPKYTVTLGDNTQEINLSADTKITINL